jgi:hypothetical protein
MYVYGLHAEFSMTEELLGIHPMRNTITGKYRLNCRL